MLRVSDLAILWKTQIIFKLQLKSTGWGMEGAHCTHKSTSFPSGLWITYYGHAAFPGAHAYCTHNRLSVFLWVYLFLGKYIKITVALMVSFKFKSWTESLFCISTPIFCELPYKLQKVFSKLLIKSDNSNQLAGQAASWN